MDITRYTIRVDEGIPRGTYRIYDRDRGEIVGWADKLQIGEMRLSFGSQAELEALGCNIEADKAVFVVNWSKIEKAQEELSPPHWTLNDRVRVQMGYNLEPKEELLWDRVRNTARPKETVMVLPLAKSIGLRHESAKQYTRKWQNRDLVRIVGGGFLQIMLTEEGLKREKLKDE